MAPRSRMLPALAAVVVPWLVAACAAASPAASAPARPSRARRDSRAGACLPFRDRQHAALPVAQRMGVGVPPAVQPGHHHDGRHRLRCRDQGTPPTGTADIGASDAFLSSGNLVTEPDLLNIPLAISAQQVNYNVPGLRPGVHIRLNGTVLARCTRDASGPGTAPAIAALNPGVPLPAHQGRAAAPGRELRRHVPVHQLPVDQRSSLEQRHRLRHHGGLAGRPRRAAPRRATAAWSPGARQRPAAWRTSASATCPQALAADSARQSLRTRPASTSCPRPPAQRRGRRASSRDAVQRDDLHGQRPGARRLSHRQLRVRDRRAPGSRPRPGRVTCRRSCTGRSPPGTRRRS